MHRKIRAGIVGTAVIGLAGAAALAAGTRPAAAHRPWANAPLRSADGTRVGTVTFTDDDPAHRTQVTVRLRNATGTSTTSFHGLHIHANDVATNGAGCVADPGQASTTWFVSADGHWKHDATELHGAHAGDLPSVFVNADGSSTMKFDVDKLTPAEVIGRAVVLHAGADNFGNVPVGSATDQYTAGATALTKTQATGNAGDRFACGVIQGI